MDVRERAIDVIAKWFRQEYNQSHEVSKQSAKCLVNHALTAAGICLVERGLLERIRDYDVDDGVAIDDWNAIVDALAHGQSGEEGT
jgi:hypothetical protein